MNKLLIIWILILIAGCSVDHSNSKYLRWVGDSTFNPAIDKADFQLCHSENQVKQYFHFGGELPYEGEKKELIKYFKTNYVPVESPQSGWIRIRFIVNCEGKTGRFRMISSNENYQEQTFDKKITDPLLALTKESTGWKVQLDEEQPKDYYQYLIFKIKEGNITQIMP